MARSGQRPGALRALRELLARAERVADERAVELLESTVGPSLRAVDREAVAAAVAGARRGEQEIDAWLVEVLSQLAPEGRRSATRAVELARSLLPHIRDLLGPETVELLRSAAREPANAESLEDLDTELIEKVAGPIDAALASYFRLEVEGIDRIPRGPALLVSNHEGGISFVQLLGMGARFYLERGVDEPIVGLMHDAMFDVPALGNLLTHLGAIRASHAAADRALGQGAKVWVAPGGNLEAFRRFDERYTIKFGERRGWVRLARRNRVPIVPVVFIGGQETFFVLDDGAYLAENLGLKRRFRIDTLPIFVGLPWGIGVGPLFHLPLPAKCKVRFLEPIPTDGHAGLTETEAEDRVYAEVTSAMQEALTQMASERRFPVIG